MTDKAIEAGARADLLPCPFCGGEAEITRHGDASRSTIYNCTDCGCRLETGEETDHGRRWNTRAIASGALVPASAVADMRERCAKVTDEFAARLRADAALARKAGCDISDAGGTLDHYADLYEGMSAAIRQLDTAPACGDYVVVRRSDLTRVVEVARRNEWVPEIERVAVQINAASRTGGGSK